ncbi:MAG: transcription-repair coupling factor, partial [Clostridia bacterium]|nr:transcription-repair coupling factor [Clostridia bacterium]
GLTVAGIDLYLPLCYGSEATALDYLRGAMLFVSEPERVKERVKNTLWQHGEDVSLLLEEGVLCRELTHFYLDWPGMCAAFERIGAVYLESFARAGYDTALRDVFNVTARQLSVWGGGLNMLYEDLRPHLAKGGFAVVMAGTQRVCATLSQDLQGEGIAAHTVTEPSSAKIPASGTVLVLPGQFSSGFEYPAIGMMVLSHGRVAAQTRPKTAAKKRPGERISSLSEITTGDFVVHSAHGIGIYEGIHKLELQGIVKDYIKIRYAGSDTLYVPVTQLDLVSKYIGPRENGAVHLSRMGGTEWQKAKSRVRAAVKDMAKELIELYAARRRIKGFAFPEDNEWQSEFEERFEYDETNDQLKCAVEIKQDMEREYPMERLLCGDVGFGKTEVALRAAFKCIMGGKQCALLVPTTILAWQHYQTILRRFEGFPIRAELLSRFRSPKQQEEIIRRLCRGEVDIVVGTHRLVQKDVAFKSLGLLIVDEEQSFGVVQKERLKETFKTVDVLTLSATPIPRTLSMALSGIRDMSVIEEAPQDRHPVQTYVLEYDTGIIADAIKKELRRGGQVYYLHNRVESIETTAERLGVLVPGARIGVAHGKMSEEELSLVWEHLLNYDIDVLVCTTIIETGVDVPNCNTLIIEDADRMGLSQLHQIRGRVGRSSRRAFAYFTFRRGKVLSDISTKRLSAIREFTEFGSGFQIALRDLEIRGAGNVLGAQQHGHMESVGYDMYLKLLNEAVLEEQGEKPASNGECMIDIQVSAHIPEDYIASVAQRLEAYRRIADIRTPEDASDVLDELIDRFSDPPQAVKSLVDVALVRNTAAALGIREITQRENVVMLFPQTIDMKSVSFLVTRLRGRVMVNAGQKPYISVKLAHGQSPVDAVREAVALLGEAQREGA